MKNWLIPAILALFIAPPAFAKDFESCTVAGKLEKPGAIQCAPLITDAGENFDFWNKMVVIKNGMEIQFLSPPNATAKVKWGLLYIMVSAAKTMNPDAQEFTMLTAATDAGMKALANGDASGALRVATARYDLMASMRSLSDGSTFPMGHHQEAWTLIVY